MRTETPPKSSAAAEPPSAGSPKRGSFLKRLLVIFAAGFVVIQLIPYGHNHSDPPVTLEPKWDSAQTRSLVATSCFDCHSNLTNWYWYTNLAPMSWLVQRDVDGGRATLNFTEWDRPQDGAGDVFDVIRNGSMPPWFYTAVHRSADLSPTQKQQMIDGLRKTYQNSPPIGGG